MNKKGKGTNVLRRFSCQYKYYRKFFQIQHWHILVYVIILIVFNSLDFLNFAFCKGKVPIINK